MYNPIARIIISDRMADFLGNDETSEMALK
jgi:hypothetical protein